MDVSHLQHFDRNWDGRNPKEGEKEPTAYRYIILVWGSGVGFRWCDTGIIYKTNATSESEAAFLALLHALTYVTYIHNMYVSMYI